MAGFWGKPFSCFANTTFLLYSHIVEVEIIFIQSLLMWALIPFILGGPTGHGLVWVIQGCGPCVIRLTIVFCDYGFSVSALWCPLTTPTILLGFLLPWMWGISSRLLQQSTATAPYLGQGVSPHRRPSWPWTWGSSFAPPAPTQPPLLGHGVAPLSRCPWPWVGDSSSQPLLHHRSLALLATAPDLGRGVVPPGCPWPWTWGSSFRLLLRCCSS